MDQLKKALAERALNAEMDHHLAGDAGAGNSRNRYGRKSVVTDSGRMALEVPRDRQASFDPLLIAKHRRRFPGKSDLAKAIRYTLGQWGALTTVLRDGRACLHNNAAERRMRPLALGRKNYLFAGSLEGGRRAAIIYTLVGTAELNGWDPQAYLRLLLDRIADHNINRIGELAPWNLRPNPP